MVVLMEHLMADQLLETTVKTMVVLLVYLMAGTIGYQMV